MSTSPFSLSTYDYHLPEERIAQHPLSEREAARLLMYDRNGEISHHTFTDLPQLLPADTLLVFNQTRVVAARLYFRRSTGALIEIFCLKPLAPFTEMSQAMQVRKETVWECFAGNSKRWKEGEALELSLPDGTVLTATLLAKKGREVEVQFNWTNTDLTWSAVLEAAGQLPLPPYIHREATTEDAEAYQTVFAREQGAVAAPTAGLHFGEGLIEALQSKGVETAYLTLHVSAGTFQPVEEAEDVRLHPMHNEQIVFTRALIAALAETQRKVVAVGTTSLRALESLYWFGAQILINPDTEEFFVPKLFPYEGGAQITADRTQAMRAILEWMDKRGIERLWGQTEIFIFPGYRFRMAEGLVTNFHMPKSTLLMLVSAFIGGDWRRVYDEALSEGYRFLSYGDGSLLWRKL